MADDKKDPELDAEDDSGGKGKGKLIIIIAVVVLVAGGAGAFFLLGGDDKAANEPAAENAEETVDQSKEPAIYVGVPQAITSNIPGKRKNRTVQIKMSFMVRGSEAEAVVKTHMPQLKNDVLMLVSQQSAEELKTPEGRAKLQAQSLETVQATLTTLVDKPTVEKVLFVSFVMQ